MKWNKRQRRRKETVGEEGRHEITARKEKKKGDRRRRVKGNEQYERIG